MAQSAISVSGDTLIPADRADAALFAPLGPLALPTFPVDALASGAHHPNSHSCGDQARIERASATAAREGSEGTRESGARCNETRIGRREEKMKKESNSSSLISNISSLCA